MRDGYLLVLSLLDHTVLAPIGLATWSLSPPGPDGCQVDSQSEQRAGAAQVDPRCC